MRLMLGAAMLLFAAACSEERTLANDASAANAAQPAASDRSGGQAVAFGLTARQLEDAEIIDASGRELADVEWLVRNPAGELVSLVVEIEDSDPDLLVTLPIEGLTLVQDGDDQDLRTSMTMDQLRALPVAQRH